MAVNKAARIAVSVPMGAQPAEGGAAAAADGFMRTAQLLPSPTKRRVGPASSGVRSNAREQWACLGAGWKGLQARATIGSSPHRSCPPPPPSMP